MASSPQPLDERDAIAASTSEFNALGERPAVYLTRPTVSISSDKPLFTARRRTVGSNPSTIPVRSEAADSKGASDNHNDEVEVGVGQRRFLRTGAARTLKGAFEAAAEIMDGPQERNLDEGEEQQREYEAQAKHTSPSFKRPMPLVRGGGTSVPGFPQRRPRNPPASSTAAATKAPGLRDAYQRVVNAEIASAIKMEATDHRPTVEYLRSTSLPDATNPPSRPLGEPQESEDVETAGLSNAARDETRVYHLLNSAAIMKGSLQVGGVHARNTDTAYFDDKENHTIESGHTAISGISSIIADETDGSFGRLLSTYAKDKQRAQGATSGDTKAFTKTKEGGRGAPPAESLERRAIFDKFDGGDIASTDTPDPPIQIPRDWGRKGKHGTDWLGRIMVGTGGKEELRENPTEDTAVDWLVAAENIPLPSIEDESTLLPRPQHQTEADPQTGFRETSVNRMGEREEPILPAQGIIPHQNRSTLLDTIREREIESLRDRAVTTNRLGEIKERTSRESLRSRTSSEDKLDYWRGDRRGSIRSEGSFSQGEAWRDAERGQTRDNKDSSPDASIAPPFAGEGEHIPFTPITIFKNSQQYGKSNHNRQSAEGNDKKQDIDGHDSRDVLRRLARATSSSPKSTDDKRKAPDYKAEDVKSEKQPQSGARQDLEDGSSTPRLPKSLKFEEQAKGGGSQSHPTPSFHINGPGAWVDTPAPEPIASGPGSPPSDYDVDNEISALGLRDFIRGPSSSPLYTRSGGLKGRPSRPDTIPRRRKSEPVVPTTRRQVEAANAKLVKQEQGNDTDLSSLFDFHPDDADNTYAAVPTGNTANVPERPRSLTNAERERQREMLVYESLNRRLRNLQTEIAEAKRGIEGLEGKISEDANMAWSMKPNWPKASANDYTITIKIPGRDFVRSFARSLVHDRKWRLLRWWFYGWCFFWVYAIIEFNF
ncbi:MAG: hypothetical protein M1840_001934 [Geoglossum simile]|nr:MAG: hypothetical protein M1840_001934 [Geoglossum simile]